MLCMLLIIYFGAYMNNRVSGCRSNNISTRHHARTSSFYLSFNVINYTLIERLLGTAVFSPVIKDGNVIQQKRPITTLAAALSK
jgi:hypothetical protein